MPRLTSEVVADERVRFSWVLLDIEAFVRLVESALPAIKQCAVASGDPVAKRWADLIEDRLRVMGRAHSSEEE